MKRHTSAKQLQVIENVNLGQLLESTKAATLSGDKLHQFLVENFDNQKFNNISSLLQVASHCQASKDHSLISLGESVLESIKKSLEARLIYCLETVLNMNYMENSLSEQLVNKLETILALESHEAQVNVIRSGALGIYKSVTPVVDWVHEAVKIQSEKIDESVYHKAFHPIVFIEEGQNDDVVLKLGNKVFNIKGNDMFETVSTSPKFAYLSTIVESLKFDHVKACFVHVDENLGQFSINESGIFKGDDANLNESFDHTTFIKDMGLIAEAKAKNPNEAYRNQKVVDGILSIHHNYNNIVEADNIVMVQNLRNSDQFAIILNENQSAYVATLASLRYPNILQKFNRIDEALDFVKTKSGYDASEFFVKAISEQSNLDKKSTLIAEKYNDIIEALEEREVKVKGQISEAKANMQFNKVKALEESLVIVQSAIIEQKQNFSRQLVIS